MTGVTTLPVPLVVGIDPSLTGTGLDVGGSRLTIGSTRYGSTWPDRRRRYLEIVAKVATAIERHPEHAAHRTVVLVEGYAFSRNGAGHADVVEAGFLLRWHLTPRCALLVEIGPSTLKKYATGKGNATKADMRVALLKRTGIDDGDENRVDAAWLRLLGLDLLELPGRVEVPAAHRAALEPVRKALAA